MTVFLSERAVLWMSDGRSWDDRRMFVRYPFDIRRMFAGCPLDIRRMFFRY